MESIQVKEISVPPRAIDVLMEGCPFYGTGLLPDTRYGGAGTDGDDATLRYVRHCTCHQPKCDVPSLSTTFFLPRSSITLPK
jgi:hypothetical protein